MACPYCASDESCEHHLLTVDLLGSEVLGGSLYDLFRARWTAIRAKTERLDDDFDKGPLFDNCLAEAEELATEGEIEEFDTLTGSVRLLHLYCPSPSEIDAAIGRYKRICETEPKI